MPKTSHRILYFLMHTLLFAALFLPPVWIPNHRSGSGDYHMLLCFIFFPLFSLLVGGVSALFPPIGWQVRLLAAAMLPAIGVHGLYFAGFNALPAVLIYCGIYTVGFFAVRLLRRALRSLRDDYRGYLRRHRGEEQK